MRVTLVSPFDPEPPAIDGRCAHVGGVERVYAELSRRLAARGHHVTVICSTNGPAEDVVQNGVRFLREPRRATVMRTPIARLARHVTREADIVQVAATYPFTTPAILRRAKEVGATAVLDFHFEPAPGTALGRLAASAYRQVGPRAYSLADAVLVRSKAYGRSAASLAAIPEDLWHVIPNGIDPARFNPNGPARPGPYLLFVGRLVPYKGLEVLLRALHRHKPGMPLYIVGDGPLRFQLESLARRLNVDVRFLGAVRDDELPALYRGATLTILPSVTRQEAFGITLLESMACGTPVVASQLPGVEDVAKVGGYTARPGDPVSLSAQIRHAIHSDFLPEGRRLAEHVHAAFSWDAVTDKVLAVYEHVLKGGGQAGVMPVAHPVGQPVL